MDGHVSSSPATAVVAGPSTSTSPARSPQGLSPPIALSKRTSSKNVLRDRSQDSASTRKARRSHSASSPPTTPPPRSRRATTKKGKQPAGSHAALAAISREERASHARHSHGLSWSSTTRDSVVDNLLFSLDNLPRDDEGERVGAPDEELERLKSMFSTGPTLPMNRTAQRGRGHTYSSSLSSDFDRTAAPDTPSTISSKGRRSNSSSNFPLQHSINGRLWNAVKPMGPGRASTDTQKTATRMNGGHSRNQSELSEGSSGYGMIVGDRIRPGRRSMSMDQLYTEPGRNGPSMLDRGRPVPSVHSKYEVPSGDGAPEPGVPSGPRRMQNPTGSGPVYVGQAAQRPSTTVRKMNTQTDLRAASNPTPSPPIPLEVRNQASDFVRASSIRGMPSIPPQVDGVGSAAAGIQTTSIRGGPAPRYRDKPGFFKRVFGGGGAARAVSGYSNRNASMEYGDLAAVPANRSSASVSAQPRAQSRQQSREANKNEPSHPPVSLNKKSSSFFRRRKKSADENAPPPALPVNGNLSNTQGRAAQPSPSISSLRKVMDPFLADGVTAGHPNTANNINKKDDLSLSRPETTESSTAEDSDNLDIFHSGYTPPLGASLGNRDPLSRASSLKPKQSAEVPESPQNRMKIRKRRMENLSQQSYFSQEPSSLQVKVEDAPAVSPLVEQTHKAGKENERPGSSASTGDEIIAMGKPTNGETELQDVGDAVTRDNDGFISTSSDRPDSKKSKKSERLFLQPTASEELLGAGHDELSPVVETSQKSSVPVTATSETFTSALASPQTPEGMYQSASSLPLPSVKVDGNEPRKSVEANGFLVENSLPAALVDEGAEYRERARKIFDGDEEDVLKTEAASWLGETNTLSRRTLQAFMQLFDLSGQNILAALRTLCGKLLLKGETQQFDRIITALSGRWCECNPHHGFKAQDVVHTIFYSVILLNTDLHLADIGEKMSRSAYVKNTLPTIKRVVADAAPNAFDDTVRPNPNTSRPTLPWTNSTGSIPPVSPTNLQASTPDRTSMEGDRPTLTKRLSMRPDFMRQGSDGLTTDLTTIGNANLLVGQPWQGPMRSWEVEIETVLKSFYASIRAEPLPLHGAAPPLEYPRPERNLSTSNSGMLRRSGSIISKAPSDNMSFRSKPGFRTMTMGLQNKYGRSRPKVYPTSTYGSSRTSFDDGSVWSPVNSSNWSKYSLNKTLTSASMQSLSHFSPSTADFKHSIGFANALSQAIIREEGANTSGSGGDNESMSMSVPGGLFEDEALALEGAPWAKEGLVKHKHHLETQGKKAKERNWNDVFAVISKGRLTLFNFNTSSKSQSMGRKTLTKAQPNGRASSVAGARVGGGDWMENAEQLDVFVLRQTIASTLPPPGYSKARPHVWALSLPSGAVHLFQVGTPEIATEFMTTANYWSARLSKEPLSGGVSNIEYGWSEAVVNPALLSLPERPESASPPQSSPQPAGGARHMHSNSIGSGLPRPSFQSSLRGSFDQGFSGAGRARLPGDKVQLADWAPPTQSMMASQLMEVDQLRGLRAYVRAVEGELAMHNELKQGIELAVSPSPMCPR